jgi:fused signal recognition particle receptor
MSLLKSFREKLAVSKSSFIGKIAETLSLRTKVDEDLMDDLEEILLQADVGPGLSSEIIEELRKKIRLNDIVESNDVQNLLLEIISEKLINDYKEQTTLFDFNKHNPLVILVIGVNGNGKTTSVIKMANLFKNNSKSVLLVAADTFRAGAIDQLNIWAKHADIPIFIKETHSDPSSVVYDSLIHAKQQKSEVVIIDTAGRQHNKANLMSELSKITRTIQKVIPEAPHETLLVLDSTTGQNAISQAYFFNEIVPISGIVLTKLDGTAKGGVILAIKKQLNIPVKLIGFGETIEDIKEFNANDFSRDIFNK